jgi:hypothetical protein
MNLLIDVLLVPLRGFAACHQPGLHTIRGTCLLVINALAQLSSCLDSQASRFTDAKFD